MDEQHICFKSSKSYSNSPNEAATGAYKMFEQQVLLSFFLFVTHDDQNLIYLQNWDPPVAAMNIDIKNSSMILIFLLKI